MTTKLAVIINSTKVPKMKKILLYEMKFLVPNYSCIQNPWLGGYRPQIPVLSVLNWICWNPTPPKQNPWVRHWQGLIFVGPQNGTCLMSPFWRLRSSGGSYIFGQFAYLRAWTRVGESCARRQKLSLQALSICFRGQWRKIQYQNSIVRLHFVRGMRSWSSRII